ncbi:hypothetical protein K439DRAFT_1640402 [Ramaria rubella]|nr:hypothetical protein K439DRAFT_1640402 [Ramaria rubella]
MTSLTPAAILAHIRVPPRTADTPTKLYTGVCHCGRFEFECRHPIVEDGFEVVSCNCSICKQRGYLIMYVDLLMSALVSVYNEAYGSNC